MISQIISIIAIAALALSSSSALSQVDFSSAIERIAKSVVVIKDDKGLGSGFIISQDGKIATNLHVIKDMIRGAVQLGNGEIFDTFTVIGVDARRDLAIIKVSGFNLPAVDLGDSELLKIGEPIAVVGSPRGLSGTVTTGVLSAIRVVDGQTVLQVDAAVNPGNSGGPMIRLDGTVAGVLVAKLKNSENINFAVPINSLRGLLGSLTQPITLSQLRDQLKGQVDVFSTKQAYPREWKSLNSINTFRLAISEDSITGENHIPTEQMKWGIYSRWDIKKIDGKWVGKNHAGGRCEFIVSKFFNTKEMRNVSEISEVEISLVTPTRIEGRIHGIRGPMDCSTGIRTGTPDFFPFNWVPAD